ncbi:thiol reductant ABC exporter subunit CydD [Paenibacillus glucanolyticus]|uniref:thiol reductant ABC exporter subunit CydD n=1 Tax=Paenibacillus TaxID=44249 RepID=UPI0003E20AAD|nr:MULTISPECIES: thiol reductant ABC exporter subunit CydD [Paenibacillus]AVV58370.1 thiol reductant ABC exporter subunit CydD [Paenibacillus glucanolyticus]ETT42587.1 cysteine ABC transporter permease/ATP-binding protein CydD [Paenibacillus sp. FSL R5-808]MCA4752248.1 thiol reductant ABC exporter subunit CydD [Mycolicibacterium fortuitum]
MKRRSSLISQQMSSQRKSMTLLAVISLALGVAIVSQAGLLAEAVQRVFVESASFSSVAVLLGLLLAVMVIRTLLSYGNGKVGLRMAGTAKTNMRAAVLQNLTHASMPSTLLGQTGGKVSIALDAVDEADSYFSQYMPRMMEAAMIPLLILVVTFTQHANTGFIMLFTAPFIPLFMILVGLKTKNKSEEKYAQLAEFSGTFLDSLQGLVTLKLFGRARHQQQEIERSSLGYRDATMGILKIAFTNTFMLESIVMLSIGIVALELAIQLLVFKSMTFHTAFLVLLLVPEFYSLLKNTGTAFHSGRTSMGAVRKVEQMLEETAGESWNANGNEGAGTSEGIDKIIAHFDPIHMPPSLELDHLRFRYAPDSFELETGRITLGPGEHIAIVGKSGSGKTTLLHLIAGLLKPASGTVLVNGSPLSQYDESAWFEYVSYITQHPYIFAGTLAENIAIGAGGNITRAEIERAAEEAGLAALTAQLEHGFDTFVGEGGRGLSGGEKQRLALARAFLKRPAIILFDEPTVGLDLHTERVLQRSIAKLAKSATMITVAHRLYTIQQADKILYMDRGVLVDAGRHDELLERLPQYAEMVDVERKRGDDHE